MSRDIFARFPAIRRVIYQSIFTIMPRLPMRPCQFLGQLIGEAVAPGFEYTDMQLGKRSAMLSAFPQHADVIKKLTR